MKGSLNTFFLQTSAIGSYLPQEHQQSHHINPEEAIQIHKDVGSQLSIGVHWGTFLMSDEPYLEPKLRFEAEARKHGWSFNSKREFQVGCVQHGETVVVVHSEEGPIILRDPLSKRPPLPLIN